MMNRLAQNAAQNGGRLTGQGYKDTISKINDIIGSTDDDALRGAMMEFKNALDDAVEQALPAHEQGAWRTVRQQYRDFLPIERAKAAPGSAASRGIISPSQLRTGVKAVEGAREVASGNRPLTRLAEAGTAIMEKQPQSGTAPRLMEELKGVIPLGMGGVPGISALLAGAPPTVAAAITLAGGAAGVIGPALRKAYTRSGLGQALLGRQGPVFPGGSRVGLPSVMVDALAARQRQMEDEQARQRQQGDQTRR
jgi:hypothetical protein